MHININNMSFYVLFSVRKKIFDEIYRINPATLIFKKDNGNDVFLPSVTTRKTAPEPN